LAVADGVVCGLQRARQQQLAPVVTLMQLQPPRHKLTHGPAWGKHTLAGRHMQIGLSVFIVAAAQLQPALPLQTASANLACQS
jgi:hypothetical protein